MKGAKKCLTHFITLCIPSFGLGRSSSPRLSRSAQRSNVSSLRLAAVSSGSSSFLRLPLFVALSLCISLSFPVTAQASIALTAWESFWTAMRAMDLAVGTWRTANAAEELQDLSAQIGCFTGSRGDMQYIAKELEKVCGYDIDKGNGYMATVYGLTGNSSYSSVRQCTDCMGGYNYVDGQQVTCGTCHGSGTCYWDEVPYTATVEAAEELSSWINYLTATQTDWSSGDSGGEQEADPYANFLTIKSYFSYNDTRSEVGTLRVAPSLVSKMQTLADQYNTKYFAFAWSNNQIQSDYLDGSDRKTLMLLRFSSAPTVTWNNSSKRYVISGGYTIVGQIQTDYDNHITGNYKELVVYNYKTFKNYYFNGSNARYCSEIIEFGLTPANQPSGTVPSGGVVNVYEGDTTNVTSSINNSSTSVENSTTIYDTENNTYTTVNNITTNNTVDVSAITQRLDSINAKVGQIGNDINGFFVSVDADLDSLFESVSDGFSDVSYWLPKIYAKISQVLNLLEDADFGTGGSGSVVDLSGLESAISGLSGDIDALLSAITGSHGSDALGLYGRLDTILNWLDDYSPADLSNIEQILEDWPEYPTFDDSDLLSAITGSHGADLLGLFGRFDNLLAWLDDYQFPDLAGISGDLSAILRDWDNFMAILEDWPDYPVTDLGNLERYFGQLLGYSVVTAGGVTYSFSDLLYNVWLDLGQLCDDFVSYWSQVVARLDGVISAIERLDLKTAYPSSPNVPRPTVSDLRDKIDWSEWDNAVSTLSHKFPFVIINDIVLILTALTRPAVTPVFDLPVPNPSDWSSPYLLHVDLSDFDSVAAVMRVGITLWVIARVSRRTLALWTSNEGSAV